MLIRVNIAEEWLSLYLPLENKVANKSWIATKMNVIMQRMTKILFEL